MVGESSLLHFEALQALYSLACMTERDCWKISTDRPRCLWRRHFFPPKWRQGFFSPLTCCRVLKMSSQVVTFVHVLMIGSILCVLFLIPHKGNWKLSYWSSFVGGTFTCKWQQVTHGVCLMCNVNSMLLAEASVYTRHVFFHWVNWNQSLYTWICIVCLWTN